MYPPHDLGGGYELTWRAAVARLRAAGHDLRVLTTDYRRPELEGAPEDPDVHRELRWYWRDHRWPRLGPRACLGIERHNAAALDRHLAAVSPDVVNWWAMGGMSLSLIERVRRAGIPAVGVVGDDWLRYGPGVDGWLRKLRRVPGPLATLVERASGVPVRVDLDAGGFWLFNSETTRRRAAESGLALPAAGVAHPGIDHELFRRAPAPPWRWRLLYVGRIDARKGVDTAIGALPSLPPEATLAVVGGGDEDHLRELRELAERLGVASRVSFGRAPREELPGVYADADVLVFPVRWEEPWGLVPLEAMAVGVPVVATGAGGSGEYLAHEDNCLLFSPRDGREALAAAVRRLAGDEDLRGRLREAGLHTAARFDRRDYERAIEEAVERAPELTRAPAGLR